MCQVIQLNEDDWYTLGFLKKSIKYYKDQNNRLIYQEAIQKEEDLFKGIVEKALTNA